MTGHFHLKIYAIIVIAIIERFKKILLKRKLNPKQKICHFTTSLGWRFMLQKTDWLKSL